MISDHSLWCVIYLSFYWHLWLEFWENRFSKNSFRKICALVSVKIIRVWVAAWQAWHFFDHFFFFLFSVTQRYRINSIHTISAPRTILRGENRVHSFIFRKLPHQVQILWYNHILCKKKTNFSLFAKFNEFLNDIFFCIYPTGHLYEKQNCHVDKIITSWNKIDKFF